MKLSGSENVLEYGSGSGNMSVILAKELKDGTLTCLDISEKWLETVRKRLRKFRRVNYILGDLTELELPSGRFDVIVVHFVIHDISPTDRQARVQKLASLLKIGGRIYLKEPTRETHGISLTEVRRLLSDVGLKEIASTERKESPIGDVLHVVYEK
jgi:ubiquinone/menaquinone biosynthesis C-methylase UbiE